jgi:hypothetical protein
VPVRRHARVFETYIADPAARRASAAAAALLTMAKRQAPAISA